MSTWSQPSAEPRACNAVQCRACSDQMVIRPMAMSSSGRANLMVTRMNSLVTRPISAHGSGRFWIHALSYQVLPGPTTGDDWINLLTGNLDKSWRFARICHRLPPNSCWLNAHSIIFFCRLNPDWIPMALLRERGMVRPLRCLRSSRSWNVPVLSAAWEKSSLFIDDDGHLTFNRLSSRQTFWISLIYVDSFILYHMLAMVFPLALRSHWSMIHICCDPFFQNVCWGFTFEARLRRHGAAVLGGKGHTGEAARKMARGFRAKWGYPQRPQKNHPN